MPLMWYGDRQRSCVEIRGYPKTRNSSIGEKERGITNKTIENRRSCFSSDNITEQDTLSDVASCFNSPISVKISFNISLSTGTYSTKQFTTNKNHQNFKNKTQTDTTPKKDNKKIW
jgi:hypothetical protein